MTETECREGRVDSKHKWSNKAPMTTYDDTTYEGGLSSVSAPGSLKDNSKSRQHPCDRPVMSYDRPVHHVTPSPFATGFP